jgi:thymidine kinase
MAELKFKYGTMASGKSLHLLATAHQFKTNNIPYQLLKSSIDTRDSNVISSRIGIEEPCITIQPDDNNIIQHIKILDGVKWILVDEAQFLTANQIDELALIVDKFNINVICYGLRTDYLTHLFEGSKRLFEIADSFEEIKSSCFCNSKTIFNARIDSNKNIVTDGEQIEIGGDSRYTSICRKCYFEKINHPLYRKNKNNLD